MNVVDVRSLYRLLWVPSRLAVAPYEVAIGPQAVLERDQTEVLHGQLGDHTRIGLNDQNWVEGCTSVDGPVAVELLGHHGVLTVAVVADDVVGVERAEGRRLRVGRVHVAGRDAFVERRQGVTLAVEVSAVEGRALLAPFMRLPSVLGLVVPAPVGGDAVVLEEGAVVMDTRFSE